MRAALRAIGRSSWPERLGRLGLCAAYLQGGLDKAFDFPAAIAEQAHFGLTPAPVFALAAIVTELVGSVLILSGILRWLGALWLAGFTLMATFLANAFWALPPGMARFAAENTFFEHLGLIGGFLIVAAVDLRRS